MSILPTPLLQLLSRPTAHLTFLCRPWYKVITGGSERSVMMVGWLGLRPCGVIIHKRGYAMPFGVNPIAIREAMDEPDPLDPLEHP